MKKKLVIITKKHISIRIIRDLKKYSLKTMKMAALKKLNMNTMLLEGVIKKQLMEKINLFTFMKA